MAGVSICIASMMYVNVDGGVIGAALFSAGLLIVLTMKYSLYTGVIGYFNFKNQRPWVELKDYLFVLIFNLVGCFPALVFYHPYAVQTLTDKLSWSLWIVLIKGMICGFLIFVAVECAKQARAYMIPVCVMAFILAGGEHCIADFCYACMAHRIDMDVVKFIAVVTIGNSVGAIFAKKVDDCVAHS